MKIKNVAVMDYFTSADGCKITETFGLPTEGINDASVAFAIVSPKSSTDPHKHDFLEWYIITKGKAVMNIGDESSRVGVGDNIFIPKGQWHSISNVEEEELEFYCFCVPAFNLNGTTMKNGSEAREGATRNFRR